MPEVIEMARWWFEVVEKSLVRPVLRYTVNCVYDPSLQRVVVALVPAFTLLLVCVVVPTKGFPV